MAAVSLGTYLKGEIPLDLVYTFTDNDGVAINLTGYTCKATVTAPDMSTASYDGSGVTLASGSVSISWVTAMTNATGTWYIEIWVDDGTHRLASPLIAYGVGHGESPTF